MSDMVVVYEFVATIRSIKGRVRTNPKQWAEELIKALREEGFHPELADDAGTVYYSMDNMYPGVVGVPLGRMKICIVVPRQEETAARSFLQKRDEQADSRVAELTGGLRRSLVLSILAAAIAFIIMACLSDEPAACLGLSLLLVFPASFILTANASLIHNISGQICALIIIVAAVAGGMYCMDKALIYIGCFLWCLPIVGIAYIFFRTHKYVRSRKKNNSS
jgi:hypothetical protein